MKLKPYEIELRGRYEFDGNSIKTDDISERIQILISSYLIEISEDSSGWNKLYQDPEDKRYWELSYPNSAMHGGGAPQLRNLSLQECNEKYQFHDQIK